MDSTFQPHFNGKVIEIRHMGYNLISAILELTDNSARKSCSSKKVRVILQKENLQLNRISVIDDGCGMSFEKLCESFIFNLLKERADGDIGKFHVGMKSALIAMGSLLRRGFPLLTQLSTMTVRFGLKMKLRRLLPLHPVISSTTMMYQSLMSPHMRQLLRSIIKVLIVPNV